MRKVFRENEKINTNAAFEKWLEVYRLYHSGYHTEAFELAIELMEGIINKFCSDAGMVRKTTTHYTLQDVEDLRQSLITEIIAHLPAYTPYAIDNVTGEKYRCLGSSFFTYHLKSVFSDYSRGGDGFGNGSVPKYHEKQKGKPQHASYDADPENENSVGRFVSSYRSVEDEYFDAMAEEELRQFNRFLDQYTRTEDRKKAMLLYANTRLAHYMSECG